MNIDIRLANYDDANDGQAVLALLDGYAQDPMGGGSPLSDYTRANLITKLRDFAGAFSVLCFVDGKPAGLINCITGFSTFKCKPIVNLHDVTVQPEFRGLGLSSKMMTFVEEHAKQLGACKLTLEVLEGNTIALASYLKFGFAGYELDPAMGKAMFYEKPL